MKHSFAQRTAKCKSGMNDHTLIAPRRESRSKSMLKGRASRELCSSGCKLRILTGPVAIPILFLRFIGVCEVRGLAGIDPPRHFPHCSMSDTGCGCRTGDNHDRSNGREHHQRNGPGSFVHLRNWPPCGVRSLRHLAPVIESLRQKRFRISGCVRFLTGGGQLLWPVISNQI